MPKKVEGMEAKMVRHFSEVSLGVAEAQLGMLGAIVKRRAETVTPGRPAQQANKGPQAALPNPPARTNKPAAKGPKPKDVEIPGTRLEDGPGLAPGRVGD